MRDSLILFLFLAVLPFLGGCALYEKLNTVATRAAETVEAAKVATVEAKAAWAEHKAKADTDKDGSLSTAEIVAYLASLVGGGGGLLLARNAKSNARKDVMEAEIAALKAKT